MRQVVFLPEQTTAALGMIRAEATQGVWDAKVAVKNAKVAVKDAKVAVKNAKEDAKLIRVAIKGNLGIADGMRKNASSFEPWGWNQTGGEHLGKSTPWQAPSHFHHEHTFQGASLPPGAYSRPDARAVYHPASTPNDPDLFAGDWACTAHNARLAVRLVLKETGQYANEEHLRQEAEKLYPKATQNLGDSSVALGIPQSAFLNTVRTELLRLRETPEDSLFLSYEELLACVRCYREKSSKARKYPLPPSCRFAPALSRTQSTNSCSCKNQGTIGQGTASGELTPPATAPLGKCSACRKYITEGDRLDRWRDWYYRGRDWLDDNWLPIVTFSLLALYLALLIILLFSAMEGS